MGKVGEDAFGHFLAQTLKKAGVDIRAVRYSKEARTTLAFVSLQDEGERDFVFYRHPGADMLFDADEVDEAYVKSAKILHFGSISLIDEPARGATHRALEIAEDGDLLISYDPNLRPNLWPNAAIAKERMLSAWTRASVIKVSEEEIVFLSGKKELINAGRSLWHENLKALVITQGRWGCIYITAKFSGQVEGFVVESVDTTGAGDGFVAGLLKGFLETEHAFEDEARMRSICAYANAIGALTTTKRGAIPALPDHKEVERFLQEQELP
jgi:fructokinase